MELISYKDFDSWARSCVTIAEHHLTQDGYVAPLLHMMGQDEDKLMNFAGSPQEDVPFCEIVGTIVQQEKALAYVFINEAWYYEAENIKETEEQLRNNTLIRAKNHPDRKECIMVSAEHPDGISIYVRKFHREGKEIIFDGATEKLPWNAHSGFGNLLRPQG